MRAIPIPVLSDSVIEHFHSCIDNRSPDECWLWQLGVDKNGYGKFSFDRKTYRSHRVAYFIHYNVDPGDLLVCHTCDNPQCCNPHHLFLGNNKANINDAKDKGRLNPAHGINHGTKTRPDRVARGENKPLSTNLTELQVNEIRRLYSEDRQTQQQIADGFGITREAVSRIIRGVNWKHIAKQDDVINLSDQTRKSNPGESNGSAKLKADDVRLIRQLYAAGGHTYESLALRFHVTPIAIRFVIIRHTWKHVE